MTWRELINYWLKEENPDEKKSKQTISTLMTTTYLLTREALVSDREGRREEAKALRTATHEIRKLIGRMEAAGLQKE